MDRLYLRDMTRNSLHNELIKLEENYMKIYDEYYSTGTRDSAFIKDLVDGILGICAIVEVYSRDKSIHTRYAIEKLKYTESYIKATLKYFEERGNNNAKCKNR